MEKVDLAIIGAGPGGYVAAIRAAQNGKSVVLIEKAELGGVCLNWGCIPTKALLHSAETLRNARQASHCGIEVSSAQANPQAVYDYSREVADTNRKGVEFLLKKNKITVIFGCAKLLSAQKDKVVLAVKNTDESREKNTQNHENTLITAQNVIIATGASPRVLDAAVADGQKILNYKQAMALTAYPKRLLTIGSGAIGLELSWFFHHVGAEVTILEAAPQIFPSADGDISRQLALSLKKQGITAHSKALFQKIEARDDSVEVHWQNAKGEGQITVVDAVLSAVGMIPHTAELGLEDVGMVLDGGGFIPVNDFMQTPIPNIYAIGDCTGKQMLAHKASAEAELAVAHLCGQNPTPLNYQNIPAALYSQPQLATTGLSEAQAKELGIKLQIGRFPFMASGKARAQNATEGVVKLLFNKENQELVGASILGGEAPEMIGYLTLAIDRKLSVKEMVKTILPHPTLAEAINEAAWGSLRLAIHA